MENEEKQQITGVIKVALTNKVGRGCIVTTATGLTGRTYNKEDLVNGKVCVYLEDNKKMLCTPSKLKVIGFID